MDVSINLSFIDFPLLQAFDGWPAPDAAMGRQVCALSLVQWLGMLRLARPHHSNSPTDIHWQYQDTNWSFRGQNVHNLMHV